MTTEKDYCKQWVETFTTPTKAISKRFNSYSLKHMVEAWCGTYISNQDFIEACKELGIRMVATDFRQINYYFCLSVRKEGLCARA